MRKRFISEHGEYDALSHHLRRPPLPHSVCTMSTAEIINPENKIFISQHTHLLKFVLCPKCIYLI